MTADRDRSGARALRLRRALVLVLAMTCTFVAAEVRADDDVPWFAAKKPRMRDADNKTEGTFPTAAPLLGYDSNTGLGLGAEGTLYFNGPKSNPLFLYAPYRQ